MKIAVLYLTHYLNEQIVYQLTKLSRNLKEWNLKSVIKYTLTVLYENTRNTLDSYLKKYPRLQSEYQIRFFPFTKETIQVHYPLMGGRYNKTGKDQACSFLVWSMLEENRGYDYYWGLEHDVRFYGDWMKFFKFYHKKKTIDLIAHDVGSRRKGWFRWKSMTNPKYKKKKARVGVFMPVIRYSRRAIELLDSEFKKGNVGHCEAVQGCILKEYGYRMRSIDGKFIGYFRYRPSLSRRRYREIREENMLYHPVKSKKN